MQPILRLYIVSGLVLLYVNSSFLAADSSQRDNCTSGFMSQERINTLLHGTRVGHIAFHTDAAIAQGIFPGMNFTCNGNIQSLIFGAIAKWTGGSNQSFPELQIWRLNESESYYTKVSNALIKVTRKNTSKFYWYNLTSPLAFKAGDILGYYQPDISTCQLALYFDYQAKEDHPAQFYGIAAPTSRLLNYASYRTNIPSVQPLLDVVTGDPTSVMPTTSHPIVSATNSILSSQVLIHESYVETVTHTPIDPLLSLFPTRTIPDDHTTTFTPLTKDLMYTLSSVTRLTTCQSVLLLTSVSSSQVEDEGPNKGIGGSICIATAVMVLLVTVVVIIVAILACVLQQRVSKLKEAMDILHMKKINEDSQVYSGDSIYIATAVVVLLVTLVVIIVAILACVLQQRRSKKDVQQTTKESVETSDEKQRRAMELHHNEQTNKYSMENLIFADKQQRKAAEVRHKEQTNKDSVENPVYAGIQQRGSKTPVELQHKEQTNKDSVENPVYTGIQQRGSKTAVEVHHNNEKTSKDSVENLL